MELDKRIGLNAGRSLEKSLLQDHPHIAFVEWWSTNQGLVEDCAERVEVRGGSRRVPRDDLRSDVVRSAS
jgi:hypothetical protein